MYAAVVAACAAAVLLPASAADARPFGQIACPGGYVCIYPDIDFAGQPWVKRAVDGSVTELPSSIRDRGSSIRNTSSRTARVYRHRLFTGSHVCVVPGGSISDLRGYNLNDQTRSLRVNDTYCGT